MLYVLMLSNQRQIEAFRAAMELGSATAASEALHISQPAVSRLLKDLEKTIGFRLFERKARGLVPTQDADNLYVEVKRSFIGLDRISQVAKAIRDKASGTVRVIALPVFADGLIASFNGRFMNAHRGITIEAETGSRALVVDGVAARAFDVGISILPVSDPLIATKPLFNSTAVLAMNADNPLTRYSIVPIKELHGHRMLGLPDNSPFQMAIGKELRRLHVEPQFIGSARTQRAICHMASTDAGIALVDKVIVNDFPNSRLVFRPIDQHIQWTVGTLVNARVSGSVATHTYLQELHREFKTDAGDDE